MPAGAFPDGPRGIVDPSCHPCHTPAPVRRVLPLLAVLAVVVVGAGCASGSGASAGSFEPRRPGTLVIATAFLPSAGFWEGSADAPEGGFEWALGEALADRFGLEDVEVVPVAFPALVGGDLGGADLALSQLTPTAGREEVLDFSTPYLSAPPAVVVAPGAEARDAFDLRALRWVTVEGSTLTEVVDDQIRPRDRPERVDGRAAALERIDTGAAEAMLLDLPVALALEQAQPDDYSVIAQLGEDEGLAAALPPGSDNTVAVDSAIRAFLADGTIDDLSREWLGAELADGAADLPLIRLRP